MIDPRRSTNFSALQPAEAPVLHAALWPRLTGRLSKHKFIHGVLLGRRESVAAEQQAQRRLGHRGDLQRTRHACAGA